MTINGLVAVLINNKKIYIKPIKHERINKKSHWGDLFTYENGVTLGLYFIPSYSEIGYKRTVERCDRLSNVITEKEFLDSFKLNKINGVNKMKTTLPCFNGFYGSLFESIIDDSVDDYLECNEVEYDDCDFNYDEIRTGIATDYSKYVSDQLNELEIKNTIKFIAIDSPRTYNFENDEIVIELEINIVDVLLKLYNYLDEFRDYILQRFTSRDGFISFVSNNSHDWLRDLMDKDDLERKLPTVLSFLLGDDEYLKLDFINNIDRYSIELNETLIQE